MKIKENVNSYMDKFVSIAKELTTNTPTADEVSEVSPDMVDMMRPVVTGLKKYFRGEVTGLENYPSEKALLVGNHNAGITFFEPFIMALELYDKFPDDPIFFLTHDAMIAIPLLKNVLLKVGCIRASRETTKKALSMGHKVVVYPGGNYEAFRTYKERNIVDFGGKKGFIKIALEENVPIVPVANVGGHETFFVLSSGHKLAEKIGVKKYLRSESFPIFLGLPWGIGLGPIFHLPLPTKLRIHFGEPISLEEYSAEDANDPEKLQEIYDIVIGKIQAIYDELSANRKSIFS